MSDFLKNLRSTHRGSQSHRGSQQRPGGPTRKEIGERYYSGNDRRAVVDRRTPLRSQSQYKEPDDLLQDSLPVIKENLSTMASSLERMAESQESLAKVQAEQHHAVSTFFENLNQILMEKIVPTLDAASAPRPIRKGTTSYASGTHHTKDEVIAIIRSMREERATYAEIAEALTEKGIPTFSGRGDWHAQTIHRLCK